eukprot:COSAG02_NODE_1346_length_13140_cov_106.669964_10_plen_82_part_00
MRTLRSYYSGGAWAPPKGGIGGGTVVNEAAFKAVAAGLKQQDLLGAIKVWQLDDWCVRYKRCPFRFETTCSPSNMTCDCVL